MNTEVPLTPPDEVAIPQEIKNAAELGKLVFFIGNGISRLYGIPSWEDLCKRMLQALVSEGVINHNKVELLLRQPLKARISIADHYFRKAKAKNEKLTYRAMLYRDIDESTLQASAYDSLARCGVKFVTTNYDNFLFKALEATNKLAETVKNIDIEGSAKEESTIDKTPMSAVHIYSDPNEFDRVKSLNNKVVFHLHGSVNDETKIVSSTLDYLQHYNNPNIRNFLEWFFDTYVIVFIGYGLEELEVLDLIVRAGSKNGRKRSSTFFLLLPLLTHEADILDQLKIYYGDQLGISLIPFSRDKEDYYAYATLLENWSGDLANRVQQTLRVEALQLLDSLINEFEGTT